MQQENCENTARPHGLALELARLGRHPKAALIFTGITLFSVVAAFGLPTPSTDALEVPRITVLENLPLPSGTPIELGAEAFLHEERIQRGETVATLLSRLGIADKASVTFLQQSKDTQSLFRQLVPGKLVTARVSDQGELQSLHFPLNGKEAALVIERRGDSFHASEQIPQTQTHVEMKSGTIRSSLFSATDAAGIPDAIATQLADIFGGDIDFHRDLRKGDHFTLIYEMYYYHGQGIRSGRIQAAEFVNAGRTYRAVFFPPQAKDSRGSYYTPDGKSLRKAFLRSPLEFSRVTSGFTSARFHPILQQWRAHKGVDYGAPSGTKVRATADGVVDFAGRQGGYGNLIVVRHSGRISTAYGHLSGFASSLRSGSRVSQGDIIGYVGTTGWATGPHLHYEFRINGEQVNPLATTLPTALPLEGNQLSAFKQHAATQLSRLEMLKQSDLAALNE